MREKKRKQKKDPYAYAQAQQRKNVNLERKKELQKERKATNGHPIYGNTTPYIESFDSAGQQEMSTVKRDADGNALEEPHSLPTTPGMRNFFLSEEELKEVTEHAYSLTKPRVGVIEAQMGTESVEEKEKQHEAVHAKATEALRRITAMDNASAKDRRHANIRRIIGEFGRHETDKFLAPRALSINPNPEPKVPRAGPDTGSSEVQIAILTEKIRTLSKALEINRGYKDIHNKRNLRVLVHRRQKLLRYMERKERGSERWTHMLEKLGLTPATWKGEISL